MELLFSVHGLDRIERNFSALYQNFEPMELMATFVLVQEGMEKYHKATWARGINDIPDTRVRWPQGTTLNLTGALLASMTDRDAPGAVRTVTPVSFSFGTSLFYGRFVNDGTTRQSPKPFLKFNTTVRQLMRAIIIERVTARYGEGASLFGSTIRGV